MSKQMNMILAAIALIFATLSLMLGLALRDAKKDKQDATNDAAHWKSVASKAYTGYLLAMSPAGKEGLIRHIVIPKDTRYENGMLLPPDNFCEKGLLQCKYVNRETK